ncbi:potassium-transporting ATPase subunit KdpA [Marinospirillum sp. MEB164]|uniref:Potassium-transporting ATPase potassium-binding subunit n=1 Tax=Marinospirillum alkalitolerans TaxID=3123374 RepID=A0ABW8PWV8_9GAMM
MTEIFLTYSLALLLAWPLGRYIAGVFAEGPGPGAKVFMPLENGLYRLMGVNGHQSMHWLHYAKSLLLLHLFLGAMIFLLLMFQGVLPLNPDSAPGMSWDLALHTTVSFLTNTNQQHYSGQAQLSFLAHTLGIVTLQFVTPAAGMAALFAILRALFAGVKKSDQDESGVGNFYRDLTRGLVRVLLPLALISALLLTWQGVPATWQGAAQVQVVDSSVEMQEQQIPLGPVASMVAIKQLGTNGGGWYGPNSSVPLENPTPLSNLIQTLSLVLIPIALVFALGLFSGRQRLTWMVLTVMLGLSVASTSLAVYSELQPNPAMASLSDGPNMEGKEVRFGPYATALWASWTTQTSNGSVNGMHDSLNPLGGLATLMNMFVNATFGGIGVGMIGFLVFTLLAAFLGSLMVGRRPTLFGKAVETREIKILALILLLQPIVILGLTALTFALPGVSGITNPGFHGVSQVLYEYTSAFANNGSGFEGLDDDSVWWNVTCVIALAFGRFLPMLLPLALASSLMQKKSLAASDSNLNVETPIFIVFLMAVMLMFALLSFLPVLVLGPIAEHLTLMQIG